MSFNIILHSSIELVGALIAIAICWLTYLQWKQLENRFLMLWIAAWGLVAVGDTIHSVIPLIVSRIEPCWEAWTWSTVRATWVMLMFFALLGAKRRELSDKAIFVTVTLSVLFLTLSLFVGHKFKFIYHDSIVHRPLDAVLTIAWIVLLVWFIKVPLLVLQAPRGFYAFMVLGAAAHATMALVSSSAFDTAFFAAHCLKFAEYGLWGIGVYLQTKNFKKRVIQRALESSADDKTVLCDLSVLLPPPERVELLQHRKQRCNAQSEFKKRSASMRDRIKLKRLESGNRERDN